MGSARGLFGWCCMMHVTSSVACGAAVAHWTAASGRGARIGLARLPWWSLRDVARGMKATLLPYGCLQLVDDLESAAERLMCCRRRRMASCTRPEPRWHSSLTRACAVFLWVPLFVRDLIFLCCGILCSFMRAVCLLGSYLGSLSSLQGCLIPPTPCALSQSG